MNLPLFCRYGKLYNEDNVAISGTHTHAGPGGYLQYVVYSVTSLGFIPQSFDAIVTAVEMSIVQAHDTLKPGSIFINTGEFNSTPLESVIVPITLSSCRNLTLMSVPSNTSSIISQDGCTKSCR